MNYIHIIANGFGVLNELVILAAIVFSIIRFGWKGLDEIDKGTYGKAAA